MAHSYPADLAEVVLRTWHDGSSLTDEYWEAVHDHDALPAPDVLETILSTCYQASLLREEERPVCFRLIVANAASFPAPGGPRTACTDSSSTSRGPCRTMSCAGSRPRSISTAR